jgi:hypothetical protein
VARKPKRPPSSATWAAQSAEARADLYASSSATDLLLALDVARDANSRRVLVQSALRAAHQAGSEREADLHSSIDILRAQVARMTRRLLAAGIDPYER